MALDKILDDEEAAKVFARLLVDTNSMGVPDEQQALRLQAWLRENPEMWKFTTDISDLDVLKTAFSKYYRIEESVDGDYERLANMVKIRPHGRKRTIYYITGIAASVLLCVGGAIWWQHATKPQPGPAVSIVKDVMPGSNKAILTLGNGETVILDSAHSGVVARQGQTNIINQANGSLAYHAGNRHDQSAQYNTVTTPRGGQYLIVLADGTKVWMDAASSLRFPTAFTGTREVELTGQAYFQVAHQRSHFRVRANNAVIEDLSTEFNINAFSDEGSVKTTLIEGSARVGTGTASKVLVPGQQMKVEENGLLTVTTPPDTREITAWKDGLFIFKNLDLKTQLREIARWYDVGIEYQGAVDQTQRIVGVAPRSETLLNLTRVLNMAGIHCKVDGKKIIVTP
jgi:ferric-dicitrate binding protein FerR (iron transport regulator)